MKTIDLKPYRDYIILALLLIILIIFASSCSVSRVFFPPPIAFPVTIESIQISHQDTGRKYYYGLQSVNGYDYPITSNNEFKVFTVINSEDELFDMMYDDLKDEPDRSTTLNAMKND